MAFIAGAATRKINCELGDDLAGQTHRRFCRRFRDDLEANVLFLADDNTSVLLVSVDLLGLDQAFVSALSARIEAQVSVPADRIILAASHTHGGPDVLGLLHDCPPNAAYLERLQDWLVASAQAAVSGALPARAGSAQGRAQVGYNRRLCWADGRHTMYGFSDRPEFTGIEGPDDPAHSVLVVVDEGGKHLGIVHSNCCHPTCLESEDFTSADLVGEARRLIRQELGTPIPVLYLQGASGDTTPWNMLKPPYWYDSEQRLQETGAALATETVRLLPEIEFSPAPVLAHAHENLSVAIRMPTPQRLAEAEAIEAAGEANTERPVYVEAVAGVLRLYRTYKDNPVETLPLHAIRIGALAITTNPCELYCQFGLDLKRRSPAGVTMISQLTNGFTGYCVTVYGAMGGGYSGEPIYWTRLETDAGYKLVDASARLLHQLWD